MKIYCYSDELNDDFEKKDKPLKPLPENYKYYKDNGLSKILTFIIYNVIARPFAFLYVKIRFHHKVVNRKTLKSVKGGGMLYINHTLMAGDAFIPNVLDFSRNNYILTGDRASSLSLMLPLMRSLGAIPVTAGGTVGLRKTSECVKKRMEEGALVTVYPEAHVWPYYTKVRDFSPASLKFAIDNSVPCFAVTNCYLKRKFGKTPKVVTYIDGPFYPDETLKKSESARDLKRRVYGAMKSRAETCSEYSVNLYVKKEAAE